MTSSREVPISLLILSAAAGLAFGCAGAPSTGNPAVPVHSSAAIAGPPAALSTSGGVIYVSCDCAPNFILAFHATDSGNVKPFRVISGPATMLDDAEGLAATHHMLFVANYGDNRVLGFPAGARGNVAPSVAISCAGLDSPFTLTVGAGGELDVLNRGQVTSVSIIPPHANGCVTSYQQLIGDATQVQGGDAVEVYEDRLTVLNVNNYITEYKADASGDAAPKAKVVGPDTGLFQLGIGQNDLAIDSTGTLYVANANGDTTEYLFGQTGDQVPVRTIQRLAGMSAPASIAVDSAGNLYALMTWHRRQVIVVYSPGASGPAQPIRVISGSRTELPVGGGLVVQE